MRFPWVSHDRLDASVAVTQGLADSLKSLTAELRAKDQLVLDANTRVLVAQSKVDAMLLEVLAFKRHDMGMPPAAFDASALDPMNSLGPQTQLAIDEFASGDREMRKYLVGRAHLMYAAARGQTDSMEAVDDEVSAAIRAGDR